MSRVMSNSGCAGARILALQNAIVLLLARRRGKVRCIMQEQHCAKCHRNCTRKYKGFFLVKQSWIHKLKEKSKTIIMIIRIFSTSFFNNSSASPLVMFLLYHLLEDEFIMISINHRVHKNTKRSAQKKKFRLTQIAQSWCQIFQPRMCWGHSLFS